MNIGGKRRTGMCSDEKSDGPDSVRRDRVGKTIPVCAFFAAAEGLFRPRIPGADRFVRTV